MWGRGSWHILLPLHGVRDTSEQVPAVTVKPWPVFRGAAAAGSPGEAGKTRLHAVSNGRSGVYVEIPFFLTEGTAQVSWPLSLCTHVPYPHGHKSTLAHPERQGHLSTVSEHGRKAERTGEGHVHAHTHTRTAHSNRVRHPAGQAQVPGQSGRFSG